MINITFQHKSVKSDALYISFVIQLPREKTIVYEIELYFTSNDIVLALIVSPTTGIRIIETTEIIITFSVISIAAPLCSYKYAR